MRKRIVLSLIIAIIAVITTSCVNPFLPIYEKIDEDGLSVFIDGVRYKELPILKWEVYPKWEGEVLGYAGDRNMILIEANGDTERNFVYIKGTFADYYDGFLYRSDIEIPEPSAECIDEIMWMDYVVGSNEQYTNTIDDREIIEQLFSVLNASDRMELYEDIIDNSEIIIMYMSCSSSTLPGAYYKLYIGMNNGKVICGNKRESEYVEMPIDLLEKIAGKTLEGILY